MSDHDDRRPNDDDLDGAEEALAGRLAVALAGRAAAVALADEAFDPTRPAWFDLADGVTDGDGARTASAPPLRRAAGVSHVAGTEDDPVVLEPLPITPLRPDGRPWIVWFAGAAAAAVLIAAIVMITAARQPSVDVGNDPALLVDPDAAWAPTWVPDGLELWRLDVGRITEAEVDAAAGDQSERSPKVAQLVESDGTRVLVTIGATGAFSAQGGPAATAVTIRGVPGTSTAVADLLGDSRDGLQLDWEESGRTYSALASEVVPGAAIAVLDRLELSDPLDPEAGFAAPDDGSVTVRTDDQRGRPVLLPVAARFGYAAGPPAGQESELTVATMGASSGVIATSIGYPSYLTTALRGEIRPDGVALLFLTGSERNVATAQAVWPDGRTVYAFGPGLDRATAERLVLGVEPVSVVDLEARAAEVSDRIGAGPVLARADLASGSVEVVEPGPLALCLTVAGQRRCGLDDRLTTRGSEVPGAARMVTGSRLVDGRWYLYAANEGPVEITVELGAGGSGTTTGTGPPDPSVPAETTTIGSWTVALLVVPDQYDRASIAFPGRSMNLPRPTS